MSKEKQQDPTNGEETKVPVEKKTSKIKTGKVSAIRFSTLEAICEALECQPGDILEYQPDSTVNIEWGKNVTD